MRYELIHELSGPPFEQNKLVIQSVIDNPDCYFINKKQFTRCPVINDLSEKYNLAFSDMYYFYKGTTFVFGTDITRYLKNYLTRRF